MIMHFNKSTNDTYAHQIFCRRVTILSISGSFTFLVWYRMLGPSALSFFFSPCHGVSKNTGGNTFFSSGLVFPLCTRQRLQIIYIYGFFKHFKLTTLMHKQSRKQNLTPEKEKDDTSSNMLILMEQHHDAVCCIWLPTFRMLAMMHLPQFLCWI